MALPSGTLRASTCTNGQERVRKAAEGSKLQTGAVDARRRTAWPCVQEPANLASMCARPRSKARGADPAVPPLPHGVPRPRAFRPYRDMLRVAWENRDQLGYAWRILTHG